jgi:hypothetical protein
MVYSPRIGPDGAFVREIAEIRDRIKSIETAPAGNIVIREQLITEDPVTGVKTIVGQLPDGSYGVQPFVGDITPPPVATTPIATAQPGFIAVTWDGLFVNNEEKPRDFEHVNVIGHKLVNGSILSSVVVGVLRLSSDTVLVTQDIAAIGETWQFSLESEDYNGNKAALSSKTATVTMLSAVTDEGVNDALDQINQDVISSQSAAASAQNAADTAQKAADDAKKAVVDLGSITGTIYTQSATPSANSNSLWIDTAHNNVPRRYLGKINRTALVANLGGGASVGSRLSSLGFAVSAISTAPTFAQASQYDLVAFDAGYAGLSSSINTLAVQLLDRGVSIFTSGNDTTAFPYLWSGYGNRGATKNPIRPSGTHPAAQGWAQYSDNDLNFYFTGIDPNATVTGVTLVGTVDQAVNVVREHPTTFARWAHVQTYATPVDALNAHLNWVADNWVVVQDQGIISAASAAASAQNKADQAFNNAASAAQAAGQAQSTADGKNTSYYLPSAPSGSGFKVGDQWFDTANNFRLKVWNGSSWVTAQDSFLAQQTADSKALVYTQATVPPSFAQVSSTVWYDTSLGLDKVVQKYWNGTAWTPVADKTATDAAAVADSKGETIYSSTEPAVAKRLPQNTWVDTTGGINIVKRWDGSAWVVAADSRIASNAAAVTAAQATADAKGITYTQSVTPPVSARLPQNIWNDTSLGDNNVVVKYWNGSTWAPIADKTATDAAAVAASKGETIYSSTAPAAAKQLPQNTWVDTTGGLNLVKRWDGSSWVVAADSRIASTATAVTAAQATADSKALVYTQATVPPASAQVASTIWNDTSLGLNNVVVKYWNGSAWTPLADKVATDAAAVAAAKTKTYFQGTQPSNTGNTTGDIWFDTANGNKPYVWNGSAWTVAQDATVNKSIFGTFSTDMDTNQPNKWMFTRYDKTGLVNNVAPSYLDIVGLAGASSLVADGTNLVVNVGDQYIGQLRTIAYVSATKTIAVTATHDDGAQIYVDGTSVYIKNVYTQNAAISFQLTAGWHVIDLLWLEQAGGDGFSAISPTFGSQFNSMYAPVSLSSVSQAVSAAQKSADTAMASQSYSLNPSFDDWTGTFPAGYSNWSSTPVKETNIIRRAPNAVRFNVPDTTTQAGIQFTSPLAHAPNLEYFTVELEFYLVSGTLGQAGVILDWNGMTGGRALVNLADEITSPVTGKWYRVSKTLRRPTSATGTWTGMGGYLMGQWTGHTGGGAAKNIIFDWINVRPSTSEEILAYNAPADAQTKATAAQNAAISAAASDATTKANTAQTNAINAAQTKIDQVWASSRSYINPTTNTTGIVAKQGPIPSIVPSVSAMGGYALQKSGSVNAWLEDWNFKQAFDPTALYRFTIRVRIVSASSASGSGFYWGLVGLASDGTSYVNMTGANSYSNQQWIVQNSKPPITGEWTDYVVYYSGLAADTPTGNGYSALNPKKVHANTRYFVPGMILDYPNGNGVWEVSHWSVDVIDSTGYQAIVDAANAKTDAINTAAADATSKANAAQAAAISAASADATAKANTAKQAAIDAAALDAQAKADQAEADATAAAAVTAQQKADAAQQAAIDAAAVTAQLKADGAEQAAIDAAALDAKAKADAAQQAAIDAAAITAQAKADAAKAAAISAAATDAQTRATQAKQDAIDAAAIDASTKSDAAQMAAIQAQAYQLNPSFEDWTGTIPANYTTFVNNPTKETTTVRTGKNAVRFNCTDTTTQKGLQFNAALAHAPYFEYLTVEIDVRLDSGSTFAGSGVLVDWGGMTGGNRATISLASEIPAPVTGRWYRVVKVIRKPATATGTFTNYSAWLMGQYSAGMGTMSVKNVIFDWINVRPATNEEITAYGTPASIQSLSDTVNTKTKSWFQPSQPPLTGNTTGDLWFDTDDNNKVYIWNGTWSVASDQRIESLNTAVSAAQTSANGKNKVIYSTSAASGTNYTAGDTWFQRDVSNNVIAMWEFTTSWQSRQLSHQVQASIDAAKISVGTLDVANRIAANAITAGKLTVSDMEEFIPNPFFHPAGEPVTQGTIVTTATSPVSAGAPYPNAVLFNARDNHPFNFPNIPVKPGDQFYLEVWVASAATAIRNFNLYMFGSTTPNGGLTAKVSTGNLAPGTTWRKVTWNFAVPATNPGYQYIRPVLQINNSGGETAAQMEWYATGFSMKRKNTGELIVDGAIKAGSAIIDNLAVSNAQIADLAINTAKIQNAAVKTAQIDDLAVTDGKIVSLNAGKITAGYLDARVIQAGSIKADKLDVTLGGNNLLSNSSFEVDSNSDGLADSWNTWTRGAGDASRTFANTRPAGLFPGSTYAQRVTSNNVSNTEASSIQSSQLFSIAPGASATITLYGRASVAGNFSVSLRCEDDTAAYKGDAAFNAAFTTSTQLFEGTVVIPAGTTRAKVTISSPSVSSGHWFEVDGIKVELGDVASAWSPMTSELLPGSIVGTMLSATAIDGKTITGALIQTETTANRGIKLTTTELAGYDASGVKNFSLTSGGTLTLKGAITSGSTISGATLTGSGIETTSALLRGIKITNTGINAYDGSGNLTFKLDANTGIVELPGIKANSITGDMIASGTITVKDLSVGDFTNLAAPVLAPDWSLAGVTRTTLGTARDGQAFKAVGSASVADAYGPRFTTQPGEQFYVEGYTTQEGTDVTVGNVYMGLRFVNTAGATISWLNATSRAASGEGLQSGKITAPATAAFAEVWLSKRAATGTVDATKSVYISDVVVRRMNGGNLIVDGAIDGKVITGATVQTEQTVSRGIKLTSTELAGYDTAGNKNFSLTSAGALTILGAIKAGSSIEGATLSAAGGYIQTSTTAARGIKFNNTGMWAYDTNGNQTFKLDAATGVVELPGLKANSITSTALAATAIDGMTITGATVQTTSTANRGIKLTGTELAGWDTNGVKNFSLTSSGALTLMGAIQSGSTITGTQVTGSSGIQTSTSATAGVKINNQGIVAYDGSNNMTFKLDATTGYLELPGIKANSINGDRLVSGSVEAGKLVVGDMTNFVVDPYMSGSGRIGGGTYLTASTNAVSAGAPYEKITQLTTRDNLENASPARPVAGNEVFYAEVWVRADASATKNLYLGMWTTSEDGSNHWNTSSTLTPSTDSWSTPAGASTWKLLKGTFVIPTTVATGKPATKTRPWIQINGTTGAETVGWFITGWNVRRQANVTTIQDGVITTNKIVASGIDGGAITAGTLTATQMKGKSITTDKLVVSSTDNLIVEADFSNGGSSWGPLNANKAINATAGRGGLPALRVTGSTALQSVTNLVNKVTVGSEDRFRGSFYIKSSVAAASGVAKLRMNAYTTATTNTSVIVATSPAVSANTWTLVEGYSPALPANTIAVEFVLDVQNAATGTVTDIDYVAMTRAADGRLVVDGAIDGKTITGALIRTAATNNRVQLDSTGLRAFDSLGNETVSISGLDGTISATGQLSAYGISKDFFTNNDVTIRAILGNKIARNSWVGYDYLQPGVYFERQDGVAQSMLEIPQLISARTTDIGMRSAHLIDDPTNKPNNRQYSSVGAGPYSAGLGSSLYDKSINEDGGNGLNGILQHSGVVAEYDYAQMYVEDGMDIGYWGSASIAVGGRNKVDDGRGTGVGGQISGAEMRIESGYSDPDPSTALVRIDRLGQLDINTTHANKAVRISSNDDGVLAVSATNGVSFKNQVDAPKYLLNGMDLSNGEVHVISSSGTIGSATVPVPRLQSFSTVAGESTSTSLATLNTGSITVANTGVYDITWSYGQSGGGVTPGARSFIEIKVDNQTVPVPIARSIFDNQEDSVTATATGIRLTAGTPIYFEVYQNSGGSKSYNSRITLKRVAGPQPTAGWGSGNIVQEGNVTVNGNLYAKHRRAEFNNGGFDVAANAVWDIGPQTLNTAAPGTLNNDFCQPGPYAGSIGFTKSGYYSFTAFVQPNGSPGGTWLRAVRGSDGRYLGQTSNGAAWENTLTITSFYFAAGDYVRFQYSASVAHNIRSWVTVTQAY